MKLVINFGINTKMTEFGSQSMTPVNVRNDAELEKIELQLRSLKQKIYINTTRVKRREAGFGS